MSCLPPAFSLRPSPLRHFVGHFLGRVQATYCPHCLPPVSPSGPVFTPVPPPPLLLPLFSVPSPPSSPSCGGGGGGRSYCPFLRSMHFAGTMQARGAALVRGKGGGGLVPFCSLFPSWPPRSLRSFLALWGGGLAVWLPSVPFVPCVPASGDKHVARTLRAHSIITL